MDDYRPIKPINLKIRVILTILFAIGSTFPLIGRLHWSVFVALPSMLILWFFALNAPYEISEGFAAIRLSRRRMYGSRFGLEVIVFFLVSVVPIVILLWILWKLVF